MRQETRTLYQFDELSEEAKKKAVEDVRAWYEFGWCDEYRQSMAAFCDEFGVTMRDWSVGPYSPVLYSHNAGNEHFRGRKLREFDPEHGPTGFCGDWPFWGEFHREFKRTGNAKQAFDDAMHAGLRAWRDDWEDSLSDDQIGEFIQDNEFEFDEHGERV